MTKVEQDNEKNEGNEDKDEEEVEENEEEAEEEEESEEESSTDDDPEDEMDKLSSLKIESLLPDELEDEVNEDKVEPMEIDEEDANSVPLKLSFPLIDLNDIDDDTELWLIQAPQEVAYDTLSNSLQTDFDPNSLNNIEVESLEGNTEENKVCASLCKLILAILRLSGLVHMKSSTAYDQNLSLKIHPSEASFLLETKILYLVRLLTDNTVIHKGKPFSKMLQIRPEYQPTVQGTVQADSKVATKPTTFQVRYIPIGDSLDPKEEKRRQQMLQNAAKKKRELQVK